MYRINVKSRGKYHNVTLGVRYCLGKKTALHFIDLMDENECEYTLEKFVRLTRNVWAWSEDEANEPEDISEFSEETLHDTVEGLDIIIM